ncbi:MAG: hypothetical protein EA339_15310 [Rhodobacteraceae bacterium]|nr:MAG: hypothetical protein EA339_15310 [Paracoccaceae bacterium]
MIADHCAVKERIFATSNPVARRRLPPRVSLALRAGVCADPSNAPNLPHGCVRYLVRASWGAQT